MAFVSTEEKQFLIDQAVNLFNAQYSKNVDPRACDIKSVVGNYGCELGYEIRPMDSSDQLILHMYFNLGSGMAFDTFRLGVLKDAVTGALGDEVYVCTGTMPSDLKNNGTYTFGWIGEPTNNDLLTIEFVDGSGPIEFVGGGYLQFVSS